MSTHTIVFGAVLIRWLRSPDAAAASDVYWARIASTRSWRRRSSGSDSLDRLGGGRAREKTPHGKRLG